MWIERYDKEHKESSLMNAQLLQEKSDHKDQILANKNLDIKYKNAQRQVDMMMAQNKKFSDALNETMAKNDNLQRELHTQKELLKQHEKMKKELVAKLKHELDTVEERFLKVIN